MQHPTVFAMGGYYFFSILVTSMPEPTATSSAQYVYLYKVTHGLAGVLTAKYGAVPIPSTTTTTTTTSVAPPAAAVQK